MDPKGLRETDKLAPWMKTLAEIGLITAYDEAAKAENVPAFMGVEANVWAERFKALLGITLALDNTARQGLEVNERGLEAAARQRENYVAVRTEMAAILERLAQGASEEREAELKERTERREKARARRQAAATRKAAAEGEGGTDA